MWSKENDRGDEKIEIAMLSKFEEEPCMSTMQSCCYKIKEMLYID